MIKTTESGVPGCRVAFSVGTLMSSAKEANDEAQQSLDHVLESISRPSRHPYLPPYCFHTIL